MFGFLYSWFVDISGPKISCTKTKTLPNLFLFALLGVDWAECQEGVLMSDWPCWFCWREWSCRSPEALSDRSSHPTETTIKESIRVSSSIWKSAMFVSFVFVFEHNGRRVCSGGKSLFIIYPSTKGTNVSNFEESRKLQNNVDVFEPLKIRWRTIHHLQLLSTWVIPYRGTGFETTTWRDARGLKSKLGFVFKRS